MANSADINAGDNTLATQYNNLRKDVLNTSSGHAHTGVDSKSIALLAVTAGMLENNINLSGYIRKSTTSLSRAFMSNDHAPGAGPTKLNFDAETFDVSGDFNTTNKRFVAPVAGYYKITVCAVCDANAIIYLYYNDNPGAQLAFPTGNVCLRDYVYMNALDKIEIYASSPAGTFQGDASGITSWAIFELVA